MKAGPRRCASCSKPVAPDALDSGAAILLLGKAYCPACKSAAASSVSLEDLARPTPAAPPPPAPRKRVPVRRAAPSKTPLLAGLGALALLAVAVLYLAFKPSPPPKPAAPATGPTSSSPAPLDPEAKAKKAFDGVEALARSEGDVERLIAAIDAARAACEGTSYAPKLEEIKKSALAEREKAAARKELDPLIEELKKAVAEDKDFRRFEELRSKFQQARELAARVSPASTASLSVLQQDYANRYEREAAPHYERIQPAAEQLAQEKRWDDALKFIDSFPAHLRGSGAWRSLAKLKERIESDRKLTPRK